MEAAIKSPDLGRLKSVAERVDRATNNLENFIRRFNGPRPEDPSPTPGPGDSYRNDLESIFTALNKLEEAVSVLDSIG